MLLTHKIKLDLTKNQTVEVENISNESRILYNHFLSKLIEEYKQNKKFISYYILQKELKDYECEYLTFDVKKEVLRNLYDNYSSFFKLIKNNRDLNPKPPKFRGVKYFFTLSFVQDFIVNDKNLILSYKGRKKIKIPLSYTEPINELVCIGNKSKSDIKQVKIFKKDDKFYASIVYLKQEDPEKAVDNNNILSIDLGKKNLLTIYDVSNNSATIYNSKYLSKNQKHLDKRTDELKSKRDLKQKYSLKHKQINNKIKKLQSKKRTQTKLTIHKVSKDLSNENKTILIGELTNLKKNTITKIRKINRQMQNNWNLQTFVHLLQYKNKLKGNQVIKVNEAWTSKTCCKCGEINYDLDLSDRQYICDCGNNLNRDVNGAINIYKHYVGDYNPPFDTLTVSERFGWCNINQMNKNY